MRLHYIAAVLLFCSPVLKAQPSQTASLADDRLRAWLSSDAKVREKINKVQVPVVAETDLKDAVADVSVGKDSERKELIARLPGLRAPKSLGCQDFDSCSVPPLAMDIPAGEPVENAIRAMLRPWIWLAEARGHRLGVAPVEGSAVLAMNIEALGLKGVGLSVEANPDGGVHIWFARALELSGIYAKERQAVQAPKP